MNTRLLSSNRAVPFVLFAFLMVALRLLAESTSPTGKVSDAGTGNTQGLEQKYTVDEVIHALDQTEARLRAFRVGVDMKIKMASDQEPGRYVDLESQSSLLMDRSGRFRYSERGTSVNWSRPVTVHPTHIEAAFDGVILRQMSGSDQLTQGLESIRPNDASMRLDLSRFLSEYEGKTVAQRLREGEGKITGSEPAEGGTALVLETRPVLVDGIEWKQRFVVLPEKAFAVVCRSAFKRYSESPEWFEYTRTESFDLTDCGEELYLPGKGVYQSWTIQKAAALKGERPFPISWRYELGFRKWKVNPPVDDRDFTLQFEPGVFLNNRISGRSYVFEGDEP